MTKAQGNQGIFVRLGRFHRTRLGYAAFGVVELSLFLWLANLAVPSGDWWEWLLVFICLFGFVQNMGRMIAGTKQ